MKYPFAFFFLLISTPALSNDVVINANIDNNNLLFSLSSNTGSISQGGQTQLFIDSDNDKDTGYSDKDIAGADFLIEGSQLYASNSHSWNWRYVKSINFDSARMPNYLSIGIDMSALSINLNSTINVGYHALDSNWNTVYRYPQMKQFPLNNPTGSSSSSSSNQNIEIVASVANNNLKVGLNSPNGTAAASAHLQYFIDSDNNASTGYSDAEVSGAEYLLEDSTLYKLRSSSGWGWRQVANTKQDNNLPNSIYSTIPLSALLITGNSINVGILALDSNWNTIKNYHNSKMINIELNLPISNHFFQAYNQAYIENSENGIADTISQIKQATNAYVIVDPFSNTGEDYAITSIISLIKNNNNEVAGYISAGTAENWRTDFNQLAPPIRTSTEWSNWPGEFFINETNTGALEVMKARIDKMADWGLNWVEFDNMDWRDTSNQYNLSVTIQESIDYINALCDYTHSKGMKCMAKNSVVNFSNFDGVSYESMPQSLKWWEADEPNGTKSFLDSGKPVIIFHYGQDTVECNSSYNFYKAEYGSNIIFSCEEGNNDGYKHYF